MITSLVIGNGCRICGSHFLDCFRQAYALFYHVLTAVTIYRRNQFTGFGSVFCRGFHNQVSIVSFHILRIPYLETIGAGRCPFALITDQTFTFFPD